MKEETWLRVHSPLWALSWGRRPRALWALVSDKHSEHEAAGVGLGLPLSAAGGGEDRRQTPKQETDPPFANNHVQEHVSTNLF